MAEQMTVNLVVPPCADGLAAKAADILSEELRLRGIGAQRRTSLSVSGAAVMIGLEADVRAAWPEAGARLDALEAPGAEGFRIAVLQADDVRVAVAGRDGRGCLYGMAHVLRKLYLKDGVLRATAELADLSLTPRYQLRGHQLAYRDKQNSCPAWDLQDFDRYIRDLLLFGANAIELLPPRTDDALYSPLFTRDPLDMMLDLSRTVHAYGMDVWLWYPNMGEDYDDPAVMEAEIAERERVFSQIPYLDAILIPAGDPGELHPRRFFEVTGRMMEVAHRYHPQAKVYVAPQVFAPEPGWYDAFYDELSREPEWLYGVCYAAWVQGTIEEMRARIPDRYKDRIRHYPDITHTASSQFEVPEWDTPFALTNGRESYCPRPLAMKHIHNLHAPYTLGSLTYSEGVHDDVNKFVWGDQDFCPERDARETVRDYARLFIDPDIAEEWTELIFALEQNWVGEARQNERIEAVYRRFEELNGRVSERTRQNYRFKMAYLRAILDCYARRRAIRDAALEAEAVACLARARETGAERAARAALETLNLTRDEPESEELVFTMQRLADELRATPGCRIQLSTQRHGGQKWIRGAWLDTLDTPLSDDQWYRLHLLSILRLTDEGERLRRIDELLNWQNPGPGGQYVCLGRIEDFRAHVVPEATWAEDPGRLRTPQLTHDPYGILMQFHANRGWAGEFPIALNWIRRARVIYGTPLVVRFEGLCPGARYSLQVTYPDFLLPGAPEEACVNLRAGGRLVHSRVRRPQGTPRCPVYRYPLPQEAYRDGTLTLTWQVYGKLCSLGVSELWIIREEGEHEEV